MILLGVAGRPAPSRHPRRTGPLRSSPPPLRRLGILICLLQIRDPLRPIFGHHLLCFSLFATKHKYSLHKAWLQPRVFYLRILSAP